MKFTFATDSEGVKLAAACAAQLVKEGVKFNILQDRFSIEITLTGGF